VVRAADAVTARAHLLQAQAQGAVACMLQTGRAAEVADVLVVPCVQVANISQALAYAAACVYGHPTFSLDVIGVTGTNGKTTITQILRKAIDAAAGFGRCGVIGTVGYQIGHDVLPATHTTPGSDEVARVAAEMRRRDATYLAMEVSSHALVQERVRAVRFRVAAFTNLTQDHLDFHGSMADYREAKAKLFTELAPGACVINIANETGRDFAARVRAPLITVSADPAQKAEVQLRTASEDEHGLRATFDSPAGVIELETRMLGAHNLENLAVVFGTLLALGLPLGPALEILRNERGVTGRLERVDEAGDEVTCIVDYAHTPDALEHVLRACRKFAKGRIWCIFGCGGDRDRAKRPLMGKAAGQLADIAILTSDNPRTEVPEAIAFDVEAGLVATGRVRTNSAAAIASTNYLVELDRAAAIAQAVAAATAGDVVLIAGKGHETYQIIGNETRHFDDAEELRAALRLRRMTR
jgi:UDP-N-acetylmuramoyl-L-alanyl-D-glutamate--2,6-diaminopimelate ligase